MRTIIETKNISKEIKKSSVLTNVSIHVPENQVYGLLGPNGAGKSTLLKIITGAWRPTAGEVLFMGQPWSRDAARRIGSMIEGAAIYPNLTAEENLKVYGHLFDLPLERIPEVLAQVDLAQTGKKSVHRFSMGMKQRLGIALALMSEPSILILDEPTNGLDPVGIQALRDFLRTLPVRGVTVLVSSHILSEIHAVADTIGILNKGQLVYEGSNTASATELERLFMAHIVQRTVRV